MPRQSQSLQRLAEEKLSAGGLGSADCLELQLDLRDEETGELLLRFGGLWNTRFREYVGDARRSHVINLHAGQRESALWFQRWMSGHFLGDAPERIFDACCYGGRRGGKTAFAMSCAVGYALACPGSIVWIVTPSDAYYNEPIDYLESIMPRGWYTMLGWPHWTFFLANGSTIIMRSGHTPRRLKQGRCDFVVINEGQAVPCQSYDTLSASIVDVGGLIMTAANPPDVGDPGTWVADLVAGADNGERQHARAFFFDPLNNPHIDHAALEALAEKYDEHTFNVQVRGMMLLPPDSVLHSWDRRENEQPAPELPDADCTREFTRFHEGRPLDDIVGIDVQNFPWIAAVRCRVFRNPKHPQDLSKALLWGVGEAYVEQGDEVDCARILKADGCLYDRTLMITDASCEWQQQQREETKQRPQYRGKGSMDMFRGEGYRNVVPPDPDMNANPHIIDRIRAANARIGTKSRERYVFMDPRRCPKTTTSIRKWRTVKSGMPSRNSRFAHGGDAITYIIWRFFPRRAERANVEVQTIKRFAGRDRVKGFSR
jgi:hypothetical protein